MSHIQSTKNFQIKGFFYIVIPLFFLSCSPTLYVLDNSPNLAGNIYKKTSVEKIQKELKENPKDLNKLKTGVEVLTTYAFGFLIEESDRLMLENYTNAKDLEFEAHQYFVEAVSYGDLAISQTNDDYYKWLNGEGELKTEINFENQDFDLFYWVAAAYGGAISSSGGNPKWIIKLPKVGKLLNSIIDINPNWNNGAALVAKISFTMNNPLLSPSEADSISKSLFNAAIDASNGKDMGPYLTYAESVSKTRQNKEEFIFLLNEALKIKVKSEENFQLTNTISKNRAEWLLNNIDEFFY